MIHVAHNKNLTMPSSEYIFGIPAAQECKYLEKTFLGKRCQSSLRRSYHAIIEFD